MEDSIEKHGVIYYLETEVAELYIGKEKSASVAISGMDVIIKDSDQNSLVLNLEEAGMLHYGLQAIINKTEAIASSD